MRILCDESVPYSMAVALRSAGFDAADIRDVGLRGATDDAVLAFAVAEDRVLVTSDVRRFGNLIATPPAATPGLIVLRMGPATAAVLCDRVRSFLLNRDPAAIRGALTILEPGQTRRRG